MSKDSFYIISGQKYTFTALLNCLLHVIKNCRLHQHALHFRRHSYSNFKTKHDRYKILIQV